jgi:hypothetical protein
LIDDICGLAIGSIEIANEILLYDFLVECGSEAVVELGYLLEVLLAF